VRRSYPLKGRRFAPFVVPIAFCGNPAIPRLAGKDPHWSNGIMHRRQFIQAAVATAVGAALPGRTRVVGAVARTPAPTEQEVTAAKLPEIYRAALRSIRPIP